MIREADLLDQILHPFALYRAALNFPQDVSRYFTCECPQLHEFELLVACASI